MQATTTSAGLAADVASNEALLSRLKGRRSGGAGSAEQAYSEALGPDTQSWSAPYTGFCVDDVLEEVEYRARDPNGLEAVRKSMRTVERRLQKAAYGVPAQQKPLAETLKEISFDVDAVPDVATALPTRSHLTEAGVLARVLASKPPSLSECLCPIVLQGGVPSAPLPAWFGGHDDEMAALPPVSAGLLQRASLSREVQSEVHRGGGGVHAQPLSASTATLPQTPAVESLSLPGEKTHMNEVLAVIKEQGRQQVSVLEGVTEAVKVVSRDATQETLHPPQPVVNVQVPQQGVPNVDVRVDTTATAAVLSSQQRILEQISGCLSALVEQGSRVEPVVVQPEPEEIVVPVVAKGKSKASLCAQLRCSTERSIQRRWYSFLLINRTQKRRRKATKRRLQLAENLLICNAKKSVFAYLHTWALFVVKKQKRRVNHRVVHQMLSVLETASKVMLWRRFYKRLAAYKNTRRFRTQEAAQHQASFLQSLLHVPTSVPTRFCTVSNLPQQGSQPFVVNAVGIEEKADVFPQHFSGGAHGALINVAVPQYDNVADQRLEEQLRGVPSAATSFRPFAKQIGLQERTVPAADAVGESIATRQQLRDTKRLKEQREARVRESTALRDAEKITSNVMEMVRQEVLAGVVREHFLQVGPGAKMQKPAPRLTTSVIDNYASSHVNVPEGEAKADVQKALLQRISAELLTAHVLHRLQPVHVANATHGAVVAALSIAAAAVFQQKQNYAFFENFNTLSSDEMRRFIGLEVERKLTAEKATRAGWDALFGEEAHARSVIQCDRTDLEEFLSRVLQFKEERTQRFLLKTLLINETEHLHRRKIVAVYGIWMEDVRYAHLLFLQRVSSSVHTHAKHHTSTDVPLHRTPSSQHLSIRHVPSFQLAVPGSPASVYSSEERLKHAKHTDEVVARSLPGSPVHSVLSHASFVEAPPTPAPAVRTEYSMHSVVRAAVTRTAHADHSNEHRIQEHHNHGHNQDHVLARSAAVQTSERVLSRGLPQGSVNDVPVARSDQRMKDVVVSRGLRTEQRRRAPVPLQPYSYLGKGAGMQLPQQLPQQEIRQNVSSVINDWFRGVAAEGLPHPPRQPAVVDPLSTKRRRGVRRGGDSTSGGSSLSPADTTTYDSDSRHKRSVPLEVPRQLAQALQRKLLSKDSTDTTLESSSGTSHTAPQVVHGREMSRDSVTTYSATTYSGTAETTGTLQPTGVLLRGAVYDEPVSRGGGMVSQVKVSATPRAGGSDATSYS